MAAAFVIDAAAWVLLALAIGLARGGIGDAVRAMGVILVVGVAALVLHRLLKTGTVQRIAVRDPDAVPFIIGVVALADAALTEHYGLTGIFGALVVGLALPARDRPGPWNDAVSSVSRWGRLLVPVFFLVTGMRVLADPLSATSWTAALVATGLAVVGKVGGSYLGARLGGQSPNTALRLGALMNTRGLTEIVVLQAGYSAGILTAPLFLVLLITTLVTTGLTGPLLSVIDRREADCEWPVAVFPGGT
jgi:Kef-type K+ transport system membrane component KefB